MQALLNEPGELECRGAPWLWANLDTGKLYAFDVTTPLMVQGAIFAILLGILGGLFPAVRAARLPVTAALREA